ncbi:MAG: alpha/beta fold hydrolase [Planctomycetes bacterium]|nr:alpha/beta fold hydrolase [Planctomycetota bacterium]
MNTRPIQQQENDASECVVLIHGLGRTERSMSSISKHLSRHGFTTYSISYPSRKHNAHQLYEGYIAPALGDILSKHTKLHFVTHSLGGILLRLLLENSSIPQLGRTVMLCPPNQGSELARKLSQFSVFRYLAGPVLTDLGTHNKNKPLLNVGAFPSSLGVIAGNCSLNPLSSSLISNTDDGAVSIAETLCPGMDEHIVMPVSHTFMLHNQKVINQIHSYLYTGSFQSVRG